MAYLLAERYRLGGLLMKCPQCHSKDLMAIAGRTYENGKTDYYMMCGQCGKQWVETR